MPNLRDADWILGSILTKLQDFPFVWRAILYKQTIKLILTNKVSIIHLSISLSTLFILTINIIMFLISDKLQQQKHKHSSIIKS